MVKEYEPDDPLELRGVVVPGDADDAMAESFVEEFVRMGFPDGAILKIFHNPFYAGPHAILVRRGEAYVREVLARVRAIWGQPRFRVEG